MLIWYTFVNCLELNDKASNCTNGYVCGRISLSNVTKRNWRLVFVVTLMLSCFADIEHLPRNISLNNIIGMNAPTLFNTLE